MSAVARLVTLVDIADAAGPGAIGAAAGVIAAGLAAPGAAAAVADSGPSGMSLSARHEAVLDDGRRIPLLDDRGWSASLGRAGSKQAGKDGSLDSDVPDIWAVTSVTDVEETARVVVGPDEPFGERSGEDLESDHWDALSDALRRQGVAADAAELKRLPHEVVLSERLLARLRS
jgi:hypothetical protein